MKNSKNKSFLDSVHGYVYIDSGYCKEIIDTPIFQRLRRIEQTSFRGLCPSARHDRFIHSLGVYHIGAKMFEEIKNNLKNDNRKFYEIVNSLFETEKNNVDGWDFLNQTFEIACLLHDCGHAPFSHTFERYYVREKSTLNDDILAQVKSYSDLDEIAHNGYDDDGIKKIEIELQSRVSKIKPHELASAWLVLHEKGFRNVFLKRKIDPVLAMRMITGCKHLKKANFKDSDGNYIINCDEIGVIPENLSERQQVENCFISLLNGHIIDADRLDYFARDRWATGLNTSSVDIDRLLSSISIEKIEGNNLENKKVDNIDEYIVCVNKRAIPELKNIIDVKEFLDYWIINHHKVVYDNKVLVKAVTKLSCLLCDDEYKESDDFEKDKSENASLYKIFDYKSFIEPIHHSFKYDGIQQNEVFYLTSDDDLVYLMKKYFCSKPEDDNDNINYAREWLYREHNLMPLWKSYAEFVDAFREFPLNTTQAYKGLVNTVKNAVNSFLNEKSTLIFFHKPLLLEQKAHPCIVDEDDGEPIYINTGKSILRYSAIPYLTGRFKTTGGLATKSIGTFTRCTNLECKYPEKLCGQLNQEYSRKDRNWEYFYLFLPRIYKKSKKGEEKKEVDKSEYETLKSDLIKRIIKEYQAL